MDTASQDQKGNPNKKRSRADDDLICAVSEGKYERVRELLSGGADANARKKNRKTVLMLSFEKKKAQMDIFELLLSSGADIHMKDNGGNTVLLIAVDEGRIEIVQKLLEAGANANDANKKSRTPLIAAATAGRADLAAMLMERGANVNGKDVFEWTPLLLASKGGHAEVIEVLCKNGAKVDEPRSDGSTPLMFAASQGKGQAISKLLEHGANASLKDQKGKTALGIADDWGWQEVVDILAPLCPQEAGVIVERHQVDDAMRRVLADIFGKIAKTDKEGAPLPAVWELGAMPAEERHVLERHFSKMDEKDGLTGRYRLFRKQFFEDYDPYIAWHDGIDTLIDYENLDSMTQREKLAAELTLYNGLEKEYDDRWVLGLLRLKSGAALDIFKRVFERDPTVKNRISVAEAILTLEPQSDHLGFLLEAIGGNEEESTKINALTSIKILISRDIYTKKPLKARKTRSDPSSQECPERLKSCLFGAMKDPSYLVRYHAYEALRMMHGIEMDVESDPIFGLLTSEKQQKDFEKAEKMLRQKTAGNV